MDKKAPQAPVRRGRGGLVFAGLLAAAALAALAPPARAEPTLLVSDKPDVPSEPPEKVPTPADAPQRFFADVPLRPNVEQHFYLFVANPVPPGTDKKDAEDATVVVALQPKEGGHDVFRSKALTVKPGEIRRVVFEAPPAAPAAPAAGPPAPAAGQPAPAAEPAALPGTALKAAPLEYQFVLLDKNDRPVGKESRRVWLMKPRDYVEPPDVQFDGPTRQLTVTLKAKTENFTGPKAAVDLVLLPERTGLVPDAPRDGAYAGTLTGPGKRLKLEARKLQFQKGRSEEGLVYLTVDGYERAFTIRTTFHLGEGKNESRLVEEHPVVYPHWQVFNRPEPRCPVRLEVDNADYDRVVEVGLDRDGDGKFSDDEIVRLAGCRQQQVSVRPDPEGGAAFVSRVRDWDTAIDSDNVFGKHDLRVRLLPPGPEGTAEPAEVFDGRQLRKEEPPVKESIKGAVVFDDSPPVLEALTVDRKGLVARKSGEAEVLEMPEGSPLSLVAEARDPESGVQDVLFFLGPPTPDAKVPDKAPAVEAVPDDPEARADPDAATRWRAVLPLATDKPAVFQVSAQVTNGAGLKSFGTIEIRLVPPPAPAKAPAGPPKPSIEGTVVDGAGRGQPNLAVSLTDAQGAARDSVRTDAAGKFLFKDVAPGSYRITAAKTASGTRGETAVLVAEGEKKTGVEVRLKLP